MCLQTNRSFNQKSKDEFVIEHSCTNLGFMILNLLEDIKSLATERNKQDNGTTKNFKIFLELSKKIRFRKNLFSRLKTRMQNLNLDWHDKGRTQANRCKSSGFELSRWIDNKSSFWNVQKIERFKQRPKNDLVNKWSCRSVKILVQSLMIEIKPQVTKK